MQQTIHDNKINKSIRNVFRTQSNIYGRVFFQIQLAVLAKKLQLDYVLNASLSIIRSQKSGAFCLSLGYKVM